MTDDGRILQVDRVSKSFGGIHAVDAATLDVRRASLTALIGPNGAGKTTLMNVISGIRAPDEGAVRFRGRDVTRWSAHRIAALGMSRTFQNIELFDTMTVRENVMVGRHLRMRAGLLAALLRLPRHFADEREAAGAADELIERLDLAEVADERVDALPYAVQRRVEAEGFSVIRSLVGHGIGRDMHEDPQIPNFGEPGTGPELAEGMVLAIEPMVNAGEAAVRIGADNWAVYSEDGSLAAHFEHTVAITAEDAQILTPWHLDEQVEGAAPRAPAAQA